MNKFPTLSDISIDTCFQLARLIGWSRSVYFPALSMISCVWPCSPGPCSWLCAWDWPLVDPDVRPAKYRQCKHVVHKITTVKKCRFIFESTLISYWANLLRSCNFPPRLPSFLSRQMMPCSMSEIFIYIYGILNIVRPLMLVKRIARPSSRLVTQ